MTTRYKTRHKTRLAWAACCALLATAPAQAANSVGAWDATADFSATSSSNVNGVWSYGSSATLGGPFAAFSQAQLTQGASNTDLQLWNSPTSFAYLGKAGALGYDCCRSVLVAPGALSLHAGGNGEYAVMRFTAPSAGSYQISASFWGQDYVRPANENVDVHVRSNGTSLFSASIVGFGPTSAQGWNGSVTLAANQSLDFMVGRGADNFFGYGSTGLTGAVALSPVPEPAAAALMFFGLAGLLAARRL
jgi:hypothetical protein